MNYIISFRRPELRHVLSKMVVPPEADVAVHIRRLQDLGYQIVEVSPPLEGDAHATELSVVRKTASPAPGELQR